MPPYNKGADGYQRFIKSLSEGQISSFYIFHGEESYLLQSSVAELRQRLCPGGLDGFNYKRMDGKNFNIGAIRDAIETLPAFAEKTLIEVHDVDLFKLDDKDKEKLLGILPELPDYICIVFIYDTVPYALPAKPPAKPPDSVERNSAILKFADVVEFTVQNQDKLIKWIKRHFADAGKSISTPDAEHLAFITGGFMSSLQGEIEKTAAYAREETVTRADIDAVVTPVLDAVAYKLTDALTRRDYAASMRLLDDLLLMREAPHKILFSIALKMRQLLAARVFIESKQDKAALMKLCGLRHEFQARLLFETARKMTLSDCRDNVLCCAGTALELNSMAEPEARLIELIVKLAHRRL